MIYLTTQLCFQKNLHIKNTMNNLVNYIQNENNIFFVWDFLSFQKLKCKVKFKMQDFCFDARGQIACVLKPRFIKNYIIANLNS